MCLELGFPTIVDYATAFGDLNNFKSSGQVFGIIPLDKESLLISYQMEPYVAEEEAVNTTQNADSCALDILSTFTKKASRQYADQFKCLAALQGTRFAIVPVHTNYEINLIIEKNIKFMPTSQQKKLDRIFEIMVSSCERQNYLL